MYAHRQRVKPRIAKRKGKRHGRRAIRAEARNRIADKPCLPSTHMEIRSRCHAHVGRARDSATRTASAIRNSISLIAGGSCFETVFYNLCVVGTGVERKVEATGFRRKTECRKCQIRKLLGKPHGAGHCDLYFSFFFFFSIEIRFNSAVCCGSAERDCRWSVSC